MNESLTGTGVCIGPATARPDLPGRDADTGPPCSEWLPVALPAGYNAGQTASTGHAPVPHLLPAVPAGITVTSFTTLATLQGRGPLHSLTAHD